MNTVIKDIEKQRNIGFLFILMGIVIGILGVIMEKMVWMSVLAVGFLIVGVLMVYSFKKVKKEPQLLDLYQTSNDERSLFLHLKAGSMSYWASLWFLFALIILSNFFEFFFPFTGVVTLMFMVLSYVLFLMINGTKY